MSEDWFEEELGEDLGPIVELIAQEIFDLQGHWQIYRSLFGSSEERWQFLISKNIPLMSLFERMLWDDILLKISRLNQHRSQGGDELLTLEQLAPRIEDVEIARKVKKLVKASKLAASKIKGYRDNVLAHTNLGLASQRNLRPSFSRVNVQAAIDASTAPITEIYEALLNQSIFPVPIGYSDQSVSFLNLIYDGRIADRRALEMFERPDWLKMGKMDR